MTREEFNELHESLCYGHEAELVINDTRCFLEWNGMTLEVYQISGETGELITCFSGADRFATVDTFFEEALLGKTMNNDFSEIAILDIE